MDFLEGERIRIVFGAYKHYKYGTFRSYGENGFCRVSLSDGDYHLFLSSIASMDGLKRGGPWRSTIPAQYMKPKETKASIAELKKQIRLMSIAMDEMQQRISELESSERRLQKQVEDLTEKVNSNKSN